MTNQDLWKLAEFTHELSGIAVQEKTLKFSRLRRADKLEYYDRVIGLVSGTPATSFQDKVILSAAKIFFTK